MATKLPVEEGYFRLADGPDPSPVLLGSYSPAAKTYFWPRRKRCPITMQPVEDCELSTEGEIYSWTFVLSPWLGSLEKAEGGGFGACQVDLPEGVRIQAPLEGKMGDWEVGMRVKLVARPVGRDDDGNELCAIAFRPITAGGAS